MLLAFLSLPGYKLLLSVTQCHTSSWWSWVKCFHSLQITLFESKQDIYILINKPLFRGTTFFCVTAATKYRIVFTNMNVALLSQLLILASSTFIFLQLLMKWSRRAGRPIAVYGPPGSNVTLPTWLWKCNDSFHETKSIKNTDIWGAWVVLSFILLHLYQYRSLWNHILFKLHFRTVLLKVFSVVKSIFAPNLVQVHDPNTDIFNTDTKYSHW